MRKRIVDKSTSWEGEQVRKTAARDRRIMTGVNGGKKVDKH